MSQRHHFQRIWRLKMAEVTYLLEIMSTAYQEIATPQTLIKGVVLISFRDNSLAVYTDILIVTETSHAFI